LKLIYEEHDGGTTVNCRLADIAEKVCEIGLEVPAIRYALSRLIMDCSPKTGPGGMRV